MRLTCKLMNIVWTCYDLLGWLDVNCQNWMLPVKNVSIDPVQYHSAEWEPKSDRGRVCQPFNEVFTACNLTACIYAYDHCWNRQKTKNGRETCVCVSAVQPLSAISSIAFYIIAVVCKNLCRPYRRLLCWSHFMFKYWLFFMICSVNRLVFLCVYSLVWFAVVV